MVSERKKDSPFIMVLTIILTISLAFNLILAVNQSGKKKLKKENVKLNQQVNGFKEEINRYQGISLSIDQVIKDANLKIEAKEKQVAGLAAGKRKTEKMNEILVHQVDSIKEQYLGVIDSLLVEREKSKVINNRIANLEELVTDLNKRLGIAGWLMADNFKVTPIKIAANNKKHGTALAKRAGEFEICFDLLPNRTTKPGSRNIYVVITAPDARILFDSRSAEHTFHHPEYNKQAECSYAEAVNYNNQKLSHCLIIKPEDTMTTGLYVAELFTDENKLGMTTFTLR